MRIDKQNVAILLGRVFLGLIFVVSGIKKVLGFGAMAGYMGAKGLPLPEFLLALTIVLEVGGGAALIAGWHAQRAAIAIFLFLIPVTLVFHAFWNADAANYQNQFNHFMKNLAIMGGMLYIAAVGPGKLSGDLLRDSFREQRHG